MKRLFLGLISRLPARLGPIVLGLILLGLAPARAVEFRWAAGTAMAGTVAASIENAGGSALRIACEAGDSRAPSLEYETKRVSLDRKRRVHVIVGPEAFLFDFEPYGDTSLAQLDARSARAELAKLVRALIASREASLTVEVPHADAFETFSLKDAAKALKGRRGGAITDPCL